MPLDPSISLNVAGGGGPNAPPLSSGMLNAGSNPLSLMSGIAGLQRTQAETANLASQNQNITNQAQLFAQQWAGRQQAGKIIAASPDLDSAFHNLASDPDVMAGYPQALNDIRQVQSTIATIGKTNTEVQNLRANIGKTNVETQGLQAGQNRDAFSGWLKAATGALADPSTLPTLTGAQLAGMPPGLRAQVAPMIQSASHALLDGLPDDSAQAKTVFNNRLVGQLMGAGVTPDSTNQILGTPATRNVGNAIQSGVTQPPQFGGGFVPSNSLLMGAPPAYHDINGLPVAAPAIAGGGGLALPVNATQTSPVANNVAGDGKPLVDSSGAAGGAASPAVGRGTGLGGVNILSPIQMDQAKALATDYSGPGLRAFQSSQQALGSLTYMDAAFDNMVKAGGMLVPGAAAGFRTELGKFVNTIAQVTGKSPPFDPSAVASVEDINKETKRMGAMVTTQFFGGSHEAAQTIQNMTSSVPSIDNTYLGGKVITDGIRAQLQRVIDQRNFENQWQADPRNQGSLVGADEEFNAQHPAEDYAKQVLGKYGLGANGFTSPEAVGKAVQSGYLTRTQARTILSSQFPDQFHSGQ